MRLEQAQPFALAEGRAIARAVSDQDSRVASQTDAAEAVPRCGKTEQAGVMGTEGPEATLELTYRAVLHGDPVVILEADSEVTKVGDRVAAAGRGAVAVDRVAVQIEGDVIRPDQDPVVRAVDEILVEGRVGGDRVTAAHGDCVRRAAA